MIKRVASLVAILGAGALIVAPSVRAESPTDRATGGGQILVGDRGAGSTIAFSAHRTSEAASGHVEFIDRAAGNGQDQVKKHGTVICLDVDGNVARMSGTWDDGGPFTLYVEDTGEGKDNADVIAISSLPEVPCELTTPVDEDMTALARGNAQVHDASAE